MKYKLIPRISILSLLLLMTTSCESPTNDTPDAAEKPSFSSTDLYQTAGTDIIISTSTADATINYTIDGTDPVSSSTVIIGDTGTSTTSFTITADMTVKAVALVEGAEPSSTAMTQYEKIFFYDGFNEGSLANWTDNPDVDTTVSIDSTLGADSTMGSLKLDNTVNNGYTDPISFDDFGAVRALFPEGMNPTYISFYMQFKESPVTNKTLSLRFWSSVDSFIDNTLILNIRLNNEYLNEAANTKFSLTTLSPDTWYHVELRNIIFTDGFSDGECDLYLDDVLVTSLALGSPGGHQQALDSIRAITLDNEVTAGADRLSWFDELLIK